MIGLAKQESEHITRGRRQTIESSINRISGHMLVRGERGEGMIKVDSSEDGDQSDHRKALDERTKRICGVGRCVGSMGE